MMVELLKHEGTAHSSRSKGVHNTQRLNEIHKLKDRNAGNISSVIKWGVRNLSYAIFMARSKRSNTAKGITEGNTRNGALSAKSKSISQTSQLKCLGFSIFSFLF